MHKEWCGNTCSECKHPCAIDSAIPCSPDCDFLGEDGSATHHECQNCDALRMYRVPINYDGAVYVRAISPEDARDRVCAMRSEDLFAKSGGQWAVDAAEETDE